MPIYRDYFIFIALLALSFLIALILKKKKIGQQLSDRRPIQLTIGVVVVYYIIKFFFGWRFTNWYFEAFLTLCVFIVLDYYIILKYNYSTKTQLIYYVLRIKVISIPIIVLAIAFFLALLSFGFGIGIMCRPVPTDTSNGEQWIYKNLYVYKKECDSRGDIVFKKKFLFFEKDVVTMRGSVVFDNLESDDPITGFLYKKNDTIYITGSYKENRRIKCIRIAILNPNYLKLEYIEPESYPLEKGEKIKLKTLDVQFLKL